MTQQETQYLIVRRLAESDLGWFAEPRRLRATRSKQRAIQFNLEVVEQILSPSQLLTGEVTVNAVCIHPLARHADNRPLAKAHKNWRLGGHAVRGDVFGKLKAGDYFVAVIATKSLEMTWTVQFQADPDSMCQLIGSLNSGQADGMACFAQSTPAFKAVVPSLFKDHIEISVRAPMETPPPAPVPMPVPKIPAPTPRGRKKSSVAERIRQPHILSQMLSISSLLSAQSQADFLNVLESVATNVRIALQSAGLIQSVDISQSAFWPTVAGKPIAFVDGGQASLASLGAAPIAIRVGSYLVVPGSREKNREVFAFERQLVDELFEPNHPSDSFFEDIGEDIGRMREVARISLEAAGAHSICKSSRKPVWVLMHGALVNPASMYESVPAFSPKGIELLLPSSERKRGERERHFISVYLRQLELLEECNASVIGVVERESTSSIVIDQVLKRLQQEGKIDSSFLNVVPQKIREFRINDSILFNCLLEEGEYLTPVKVDRNDLRRAARGFEDVVEKYPKPLVSYVKPSDWAHPLRVEMFGRTLPLVSDAMALVVHSSRLLPRYVFPAGLDIVDKHVKVPNWMSRPINTHLAAQLMRRALDSGSPAVVNEVRRLLCGTTRDWLFRPTCD